MVTMDSDRLRRAVHLDVITTGRDTWVVSGGSAPHRVTLYGSRFVCGCSDYSIRANVCKHQLAVRLSRGDPSVLQGLRELLPLKGTRMTTKLKA